MELYRSKYSAKRPRADTRSFRNSRNTESTTVTCADCGTRCQIPFVPKTDRPVYCSDCFRQNKPSSFDRPQNNSRHDRYSRDDRHSRDDRYSKNDRYSKDNRRRDDSRHDRYSRDDRHSRNDSRGDRFSESATVTCADCGNDCTVPFVPKHDRPVYCSDCFRKNKNHNDSKYSQNNSRNERYSRHENFESNKFRSSSRDERSRGPRSKSEKFQKKQSSFYSDGSDKFYDSLKEKLFEILGGKVCTSCGFSDDRALGFSHKSDDQMFDNIRRGGAASSWGKYISEPDIARKELKVLCLNCNQINQPVSEPKPKKKSRYFPR